MNHHDHHIAKTDDFDAHMRLTRSRRQERADKMAAMYNDPENPHSMEDIAKEFGLTRERVRQIFAKYGIERRPQGQTLHLKTERQHGLE